MAKSGKRRTRASPSATILASTTTSENSENTDSSSPYFLPDLIPLVASRLTTLEDFFTLGAACRTYRVRLPPSSTNLASQGPLLLVRHHTASSSESLYHVPRRRILRFRLPRTRRDPILTCFRSFRRLFCAHSVDFTSFHSFGCRVAIHESNNGRRELRICHLLTGERARLPDPPKCPGCLIFSGDLVLSFTRWRREVYYCRIGDAHWRVARWDEGYGIYTLMFVKGTLYALIYPNFQLAVVELQNNSVALSFLGDNPSAPTIPDIHQFWLADCHGELLLIIKTAVQYCVFRWQSGEKKWARTNSLGGCSLFFNTQEFAGCLGPDHPGVRRDCLYFTGHFGDWTEYSLVDNSRSLHEIVADYPRREGMKKCIPLAWVLPSIC